MDYKENFFKMFEELDNAKCALDKVISSIEQMEDEVFCKFVKSNPSKEDAGRMSSLIRSETDSAFAVE